MFRFALLRHSARMENATKHYYSNVFSKFRNSVKSGISRSRARTLRNVDFHDFSGNRKMHESVYIYVRDEMATDVGRRPEAKVAKCNTF